MADEQLTLQNYMVSRPAAVVPASTEDMMLILQSGVVRKIPAVQLAKVAFLTGESEPPENAVGGPGDYYFCPVGDYNLYGPKLGDNTWNPASVRSLRGNGNTWSDVQTVNQSMSLEGHDRIFRGDTSGGALIWTAPAATGNKGRQLYVENIGSGGNDLTLNAAAGETIEGESGILLSDGIGMKFYSDGENWFRLKI